MKNGYFCWSVYCGFSLFLNVHILNVHVLNGYIFTCKFDGDIHLEPYISNDFFSFPKLAYFRITNKLYIASQKSRLYISSPSMKPNLTWWGGFETKRFQESGSIRRNQMSVALATVRLNVSLLTCYVKTWVNAD